MKDRSLSFPRGVIEDVLIKVDKFIFTVDFIILKMEEDKEIPLSFGRPFLATGRALIDIHTGQLIKRVADQQVTLDIHSSMKHHDSENVSAISVIEEKEGSELHKYSDLMETALTGIYKEDDVEVIVMIRSMDAIHKWMKNQFESLGVPLGKLNKIKPSIEEPPSLELK